MAGYMDTPNGGPMTSESARDVLKVPLFALMIGSPWCAVKPSLREQIVHAATMEEIAHRYSDKRTTVDAPCGARVQILDRGWPPRVSSLPDGWSRCGECQRETGNRRPAS